MRSRASLTKSASPETETPTHATRSHYAAPRRALIARPAGGCACGGGCPRCGSKLRVGSTNDPLEREANRIAGQIVGPEPSKVQRQATATSEMSAPASVASVLSATGNPLPAAVRATFEPRFRRDFGDVWIHTDARAASSARDIQARAYTFERNIVFGARQFLPETHAGQRLLAHELAHVAQQDSVAADLHAGSRAASPGMIRRQDATQEGELKVAPGERDIVYQIAILEKPGDVADFWDKHVKPDREGWAQPLSELEREYIAAFRDPSTPAVLQMRPPVDPLHFDADEARECERLFGTGPDAAQRYANYETRRRIVANYVWKHPATVRLQLGLYRLVRDVNPLHFAFERGWQVGSGKEMFTEQDVSRLGAAGEFLASLALVYGIGRGLKAIRPLPAAYGPPRPLTDPIYDLPPEGGGMTINGRWYTEHSLERMAPDTPQVRAELRTRATNRLERIGVKPGNPAYDNALAKVLKKIHPRGVPPSVVEAEIMKPGSTNVKVITANRGKVVVTVIPR